MGATSWRKVPQVEKDKLWESIKSFFIVEDSFKPWVMKSAGKKFRGFKAFLKKKFYVATLTKRENILNGCQNRIPPKQWASLVTNWSTQEAKVLAAKNKLLRANQNNCSHTAGTRSFAVAHRELEIKEGRPVGRVELFFATHLNSKGLPVNDWASSKMVEIQKSCEQDPSMLRDDHDDELYNKVFPMAKQSRTHGFGLVAGGKTTEKINHLLYCVVPDLEYCFVNYTVIHLEAIYCCVNCTVINYVIFILK